MNFHLPIFSDVLVNHYLIPGTLCNLAETTDRMLMPYNRWI